MTNPLIYVPDETGEFNFSATMINLFIGNSQAFYHRVIKKDMDTNINNTYTTLGTIIHYVLHRLITMTIDKDEIEKHISEFIQYEADRHEIDYKHINKWRDMYNATLIYLSNNYYLKDCKSEFRLRTPLDKDERVWFNGTIDLLTRDNELLDFKTTSQLSPIKEIPQAYQTQLYAYCYLLEANEYPLPKAMGNIYIHTPRIGEISEKSGRPLEDYPAKAYKLLLEFNQEQYNVVKKQIHLIKDAILCDNHRIAFRLLDEGE